MKLRFALLFIVICFLFAACSAGTEDVVSVDATPSDASVSDAVIETTDDVSETTEPDTKFYPVYGVIPESEPVDASFFDDCAFVGDSISLKLCYYAASTGCLGNAQFFTSGSLSATNSLWKVSENSVHPSYRGEKMRVEDCIERSGAKYVYLMLGMNDLGIGEFDELIENYTELISLIKQKSPDVEIIIESVTPMIASGPIEGSMLNNRRIKEYNERLKDLCEANDLYYLDVAPVFYDEDGESLIYSYCSDPDDMGIHFTDEACKAWTDYLLCHPVYTE